MAPTLRHGEQALAWFPAVPSCRVGDVVVVALPDRPLSVKRIVEVQDDSVRVEGDNPHGSTDSRTFGPVRRADVRGRVIARLWPRPTVRGFRRSG
jgi:hypothetical protein